MGMQNAGDGKGLGDSPPPLRVFPHKGGFLRIEEAAPCPRSCWVLAYGVLMGPRGCWGHPVPTPSPCTALGQPGSPKRAGGDGCWGALGDSVPLEPRLGHQHPARKADGDGALKQCDKVTLGTKGRTESGSVPFPALFRDPAGSSFCFSC